MPFPSLISTRMLCLLLSYLIRSRLALLELLLWISTVLSQGISYPTRLLVWEFLLFSSVLPFTYASLCRLLLLLGVLVLLLGVLLRCAEAIPVKMKFTIEKPSLRLMRLNS